MEATERVPAPRGAMTDSDYLGVWRLVSSLVRTPNDEVFSLYGDGKGFVQYQRSGRVVGLADDMSRPSLLSDDFVLADLGEIRAAYEGFAGYEGTYQFDSDQPAFVHSVELSSIVFFEGEVYLRPCKLGAGTLTLVPPPQHIGGVDLRPRIVYERDTRPELDLSDQQARIVGLWRIVSATLVDQTGNEVQMYGPSPRGFLSYDQYGRMASIVASPDRPHFASGDWRDGTDDEIRRAFTEFIQISGTYAVDPAAGTILHHVELSLFPNWQGSDRLRTYRIDGDCLVTEEQMLFGGRRVTSRVVWELESRNAVD